MMLLFWIAVGVIIGLFIPGPFNESIKSVLKSLWHKVIDRFKG